LLRAPDSEARAALYGELVKDLRVAVRHVARAA
jgi:hypothetical protein